MILFDFGGKIKGDSTYPDHKDWIQVSSAQIGVGRGISSTSGGADRETSTPSFSEVTMSKNADVASVDLFVESAGGKDPKKALVHFCNVSGKSIDVYMVWELENALISSWSVSSGGERPTESFAVNFTQIKVSYTRFEQGGKQTKISPKGWNLETDQQL
jgi:type VI secretion system secreted protein Hcp